MLVLYQRASQAWVLTGRYKSGPQQQTCSERMSTEGTMEERVASRCSVSLSRSMQCCRSTPMDLASACGVVDVQCEPLLCSSHVAKGHLDWQVGVWLLAVVVDGTRDTHTSCTSIGTSGICRQFGGEFLKGRPQTVENNRSIRQGRSILVLIDVGRKQPSSNACTLEQCLS